MRVSQEQSCNLLADSVEKAYTAAGIVKKEQQQQQQHPAFWLSKFSCLSALLPPKSTTCTTHCIYCAIAPAGMLLPLQLALAQIQKRPSAHLLTLLLSLAWEPAPQQQQQQQQHQEPLLQRQQQQQASPLSSAMQQHSQQHTHQRKLSNTLLQNHRQQQQQQGKTLRCKTVQYQQRAQNLARCGSMLQHLQPHSRRPHKLKVQQQ
jgi:hypothetical protein